MKKKNKAQFRTFPYAQIEFVSPYALDECVKRIQSLDESDKRVYASDSIQIHTLEWQTDRYHFGIVRDGGKYWEIKGYGELSYLTDEQTSVSATAKISRGSSYLLIVTAILLIFISFGLATVRFWATYCLWFAFVSMFIFWILDQSSLSKKSKQLLYTIEECLLPDRKVKQKNT